jgi:hypothetical protein
MYLKMDSGSEEMSFQPLVNSSYGDKIRDETFIHQSR